MAGPAGSSGGFLTASTAARLLGFGFLAAATLILGTTGFAAYLPSRPEFGRSLLDQLYYSIQLFFVASEPVKNGGPLPVPLQIARFSGPVVTASALIEVAAAVFTTQRQLWRARLSRQHAVVCGSGRDALLLIQRLRAAGTAVVMVEPRPTDDVVHACRFTRASLIVGDPTDQAVLRSAGIVNADSVYALSSSGAVNTSIAVAARAVKRGRRNPLNCFALMPDRDLRAALLARGMGRTEGGFSLVLFSTDEIAARVLSRHVPPAPAAGVAEQHVVVAGLDDFGQTLALELARRWRVHVNLGYPRLKVTLVGSDAAALGAVLRRRFPTLDAICDVTFVTTEVTTLLDTHSALLESADSVYVCADDDTEGVKTGLAMLRVLRDKSVHITVRVSDRGAELNEAFHGANGRLFDDASGSLQVFGTLDTACHPDAIREGILQEEIARALHDEYVVQCVRNGDSLLTNPSMRPWDELPGNLKEANRAQAGQVGEKLLAIRCVVVPSFDGALPFAFRDHPDEVEQLARLEHQRWVEERTATGYVYGPVKRGREHPSLIDWDRLSDSAREKNRVFIRALPRILAGAGFQVLRVHADLMTGAS
jgi:hypothetical protein